MMSVSLGKNAAEEVQRLAFARLGFTPRDIYELMPLNGGQTAPALPNLTELLELDTGPIDAQETADLGGDLPMSFPAI